MQVKPFNLIALALFFAFGALNATAAIINYDDIISDSFYDTDTSLVWIDFGITNNRQYVKTLEQLEAGGIYEGWRVPTLNEVMQMFSNLANVEGKQADVEYGPTDTLGIYSAADANSVGADDSIWDPIFDAIGYNTTFSGGLATYSEALFEGSDGLSRLFITDRGNSLSITNEPVSDFLDLWDHDNFDSARTSAYEGLSTLLVQDVPTNSVPVPSSFLLFIIGLISILLSKCKLSLNSKQHGVSNAAVERLQA